MEQILLPVTYAVVGGLLIGGAGVALAWHWWLSRSPNLLWELYLRALVNEREVD